jgi:hypothetical protein
VRNNCAISVRTVSCGEMTAIIRTLSEAALSLSNKSIKQTF